MLGPQLSYLHLGVAGQRDQAEVDVRSTHLGVHEVADGLLAGQQSEVGVLQQIDGEVSIEVVQISVYDVDAALFGVEVGHLTDLLHVVGALEERFPPGHHADVHSPMLVPPPAGGIVDGDILLLHVVGRQDLT